MREGWSLPSYLIHFPRLREDGEVGDFKISGGGGARICSHPSRSCKALGAPGLCTGRQQVLNSSSLVLKPDHSQVCLQGGLSKGPASGGRAEGKVSQQLQA